MSEPQPADTPPTPPAPPADNPPPTPPIVPTPPPEGASNGEVLEAVKGLAEVVNTLVNRSAGVEPDSAPVKKPWTQWGSS